MHWELKYEMQTESTKSDTFLLNWQPFNLINFKFLIFVIINFGISLVGIVGPDRENNDWDLKFVTHTL